MRSSDENSTLNVAVKAEVSKQKIISGQEKTQKTKGLKLQAVSDLDPGYNSLDSDSGSPISSTKKPNMKVNDTKPKETNQESKVEKLNDKLEQSIEQNLVEKFRRRAESVGDDPSTPESFVQLHLDASTSKPKNESKTTIKQEKDDNFQTKQVLGGKLKENEDVNSLAKNMERNLVLVSRGLEQKRDHQGTPSYPQFQQHNLYCSPDQIQMPAMFTRTEGPRPKRIHVPGGVILPPGSNLKQPSQTDMIQRFNQPGMLHNQQQIQSNMMYPTRPFEETNWPEDFPPQFSPQATFSLPNGNSVTVKEEPPSPLASHFSPCHGYNRSPEHKSEAINEIVKYLKQDNSQSPPYLSPSSSHGSPYTPINPVFDNFPDTPPPSVEPPKSYAVNSPQSVSSSCYTDDTMPVSPPQMSPHTDASNVSAIMDWEQEVNRLSIECLMEQDAEDKDTCLHVVVTQGRGDLAVAIAKKLSKVKGALDIQNKLGQTPVFLATVVNMPFLVRDLIQLGADPSIKDNSGSTPLHYAAMKGFTEVVTNVYYGLQSTPHQHLLQEFNVDLKDYEGKTALHYAIEHHGKTETVFTADSQCASQVQVWNKELVELLFFMNASTTGQDGKSGKTPLHYAVENLKLDLIDLILEHDQTSECVNKGTFSQCTPLHLAVGLKTDEALIVEIVRRLMRNGADVSKENVEKEKAIGLNPRNHLLVRNILAGRS
ncbi:uncharacterized protein [Antedon mediterranea]|uniref:uncharacterized protein n=1 Tax=Antedon mediterranea TaxID=105859 RepID=UPI003AF739ED